MFEGDYCPNCDNYIKALETENTEMRKELQALRKKYIADLEIENADLELESIAAQWQALAALEENKALREAIEGALSAMTLGEAENILNAALKQGEE